MFIIGSGNCFGKLINKLQRILRPCIAIRLKCATSSIICARTFKKHPEVFASIPNRISISWTNMTTTCRSKKNQLELFMVLTIYGSKSNNLTLTLMHVTRITWIKIRLINSKMAKYYSIFARMLFDIRFEVEYLDLEPSFFCFVYYST